ncbi:hypothetical protein [Kitasatospora sp. NPDC057223]|uniref:hypothetical protein n=1 Tax=Kitasatospora sp. NPDC057223 TaxID=3346055 RepID=UPI00362F512E
MTGRTDKLAELDLRELAEALGARTLGVSELGPGQWLGVVELLTLRLTDECDQLSVESWATCSRALAYTLEAAVDSGSIDHHEAVVRRLNLSAALLRRFPPNMEIDLLNPNRVVEVFFGEISMSTEEAREKSVDWRNQDIADIRRLRIARGLVWPTLLAVHAAFGDEFDPRLKEWEDIFPSLP